MHTATLPLFEPEKTAQCRVFKQIIYQWPLSLIVWTISLHPQLIISLYEVSIMHIYLHTFKRLHLFFIFCQVKGYIFSFLLRATFSRISFLLREYNSLVLRQRFWSAHWINSSTTTKKIAELFFMCHYNYKGNLKIASVKEGINIYKTIRI